MPIASPRAAGGALRESTGAGERLPPTGTCHVPCHPGHAAGERSRRCRHPPVLLLNEHEIRRRATGARAQLGHGALPSTGRSEEHVCDAIPDETRRVEHEAAPIEGEIGDNPAKVVLGGAERPLPITRDADAKDAAVRSSRRALRQNGERRGCYLQELQSPPGARGGRAAAPDTGPSLGAR